MRFCAAVALASPFLLSACALYPVPEDVARVTTVQIVEHIRCEVREALKKYAYRADHTPFTEADVDQKVIDARLHSVFDVLRDMRRKTLNVLNNDAYLKSRRMATVGETDEFNKIMELSSKNDEIKCEIGLDYKIKCSNKPERAGNAEDEGKAPSILTKRIQWNINKLYKDSKCIGDQFEILSKFISSSARLTRRVEFAALKEKRDDLIKTFQCLEAMHGYYQNKKPSQETSETCRSIARYMAGRTMCKPGVRDEATRLAIVESDKKKRDKLTARLDQEKRDARTRLVQKDLRETLQGVALGFSFEFTMTDSDSSSVGLDFSMPFSKGSFTLGVALSEDKTRANTRIFDLAENVSHLMSDAKHCEARGANWRYPLTGEIGLAEVVKTFLDLAKVDGFFKEDRKSGKEGEKGDSAKAEEFSDEIEFTTQIEGGLTPVLSLGSVANQLRLVKATPSRSGKRKDVHKVKILFVKQADRDERDEDTFYAVSAASSPVRRALMVLKERRNEYFLRNVIRQELRLQ